MADGGQGRRISYLKAVSEAVDEEMARDPSVIVMAEDARSGLHGVTTPEIVAKYPDHRVLDLPISEIGFAGAAIGAAMTGLRPVVDFTLASFTYVAMDQLVGQAAKNRYQFGGQCDIPVVFRATMYYRGSSAAQSSDRPYSTFMTVPGLKIVVPSSPADAKGLLKSAIRDPDPVLCFESMPLWRSQGEVPGGDHLVPLGLCEVKRPGTDVTVVAIGEAVSAALTAADRASTHGISVEVVDPRTLVPLDMETILTSVARTGRLVVADPGHLTCSAASEIAASVVERGFHHLRSPVLRVATPDVPVPFSPSLEKGLYPDADRILRAVRQVADAAPV